MFAQRSPAVIVYNVLGAIFGYVGLFFVLRYIGTTDWGFVAFGIGFVGVISLVGDLGFSTAHTIKISEGEDVGTCNGTFLAVKLILGMIFVGLVVASLFIWTKVLHNGFESPIEYWVILSLIPYYFFQNFTGFTATYYKATLRSVRFAIPPLVEAILRNSIFVVLALVMELLPGTISTYRIALYVSGTYSVTYTVYFIVALYIGRPWKIGKPTRRMVRSYTLLALPLMVVSSVGTVSGNIDKVFLQFFWHAIPTGAFYTSQQISTVLTTMASSLFMFFIPLMVRYKNTGGKEQHNRAIYDFENMLALFLLPLVVVLVVLAPYVLNIFTGGYIIFSEMLSLLAIRAFFAALNTPYYSAIASRSRTRTIAKIDTFILLLNIILIGILVPPSIGGFTRLSLGWSGAPVAMLVSTMVGSLIYRLTVTKMEHIKYNFHPVRLILPMAAQIFMIVFVSMIIVPRDILVLAPVAVGSLGVYFAVALLIKETTFSQLKEIAKNFLPRSLFEQYKEEINTV